MKPSLFAMCTRHLDPSNKPSRRKYSCVYSKLLVVKIHFTYCVYCIYRAKVFWHLPANVRCCGFFFFFLILENIDSIRIQNLRTAILNTTENVNFFLARFAVRYEFSEKYFCESNGFNEPR